MARSRRGGGRDHTRPSGGRQGHHDLTPQIPNPNDVDGDETQPPESEHQLHIGMNIGGIDGGSSSHHGGSSAHHGDSSTHHGGPYSHHGGSSTHHVCPSRDNLPELSPEGLWFHKGVVVRLVTESIQSNYDFPYLNWSEMTFPVREKWFRTFKTYFRWKPEIERDVRDGYYHKAAERLKDLVHKAASKGRMGWMSEKTQADFHKRRQEAGFKERSKRSRENKIKGSEKAGNSIHPGHHQGSVSAAEIAERMGRKEGKMPTAADLFLHTHSKKEGDCRVLTTQKSKRALEHYNKLTEEYSREGNNRDPNEVFFEAVGGYKKGKVYGLGNSASIYFEQPSSRSRPWTCPRATQMPFDPNQTTILEEIRQGMGRLYESVEKSRDAIERLEGWRADMTRRDAEEAQRRAEDSRRIEDVWKWYLGMSQTQYPCSSFPLHYLCDPRDPPDPSAGGGVSGSFPIRI